MNIFDYLWNISSSEAKLSDGWMVVIPKEIKIHTSKTGIKGIL